MVNVLEGLYVVTAAVLLISAIQLARGRKATARRMLALGLLGATAAALMYWMLGRAPEGAAPVPAAGDVVVGPRSPDPDSGGYLASGACPFECCVYGRWQMQSRAVLRAWPSERAESLHVLAAGDSIRADSGFVRVNPPGLAIVTRANPTGVPDSVPVRPGDSIEILDYHGEGYQSARLRGRVFTAEAYWDSIGTHGLRLVRTPVQRWWVHATVGARRGWMFMDSVRVRGADACGG